MLTRPVARQPLPARMDIGSDSDAEVAELTAGLADGFTMNMDCSASSASASDDSVSEDGGCDVQQAARSETTLQIAADSSDEDVSAKGSAHRLSPIIVSDEGWAVGVDSGSYIHHRTAPLGVQGQVLLGNVMQNLSSLDTCALQYLNGLLRGGMQKTIGLATDVAAALLGLTAYCVLGVWEKLRENRWLPAVPLATGCRRRCRKRSKDAVAQERREKAIESMTILSREVIARSRGACGLFVRSLIEALTLGKRAYWG